MPGKKKVGQKGGKASRFTTMEVAVSTRRLAASMLIAAMVLAIASVGVAAEVVQFKTIVTSAQPVPGMPGFTFGDNFKWTADSSEVVFKSILKGPGITTANDEAFWIGNGSSITGIVREGDQVPGLGAGVTFKNAPIVRVADGGHIYLKNDVQGPGVGGFNDEYIFTGTPGSLQIIARERLLAGDQTADSFVSFGNNTGSINSSGKVIFSGTRYGETSSSTWLSNGGSLSRIPSGGTTINNTDDIHIVSSSGERLLLAGSTTPVNIAVVGDSAPGTDSGVLFSTFEASTSNNARQVLFRATLAGPGVTSSNNFGYWIGQPGDVRKVLRAGEEIPGLPGVFWGGGTFLPTMSENGRAALDMGLTGNGVNASNDRALVTGAPGDIRIIAREGDQAPGLGSGVVQQFMSSPAISDSGRVAFGSQLSGPGVTDANKSALWQYTPDDDMVRLLLRSGDVLEVAPGDLRTIQALGVGSILPLHMPDQVVFEATFTDGTRGIFLASVPEPGTIAAAALLLMLRRKRFTF